MQKQAKRQWRGGIISIEVAGGYVAAPARREQWLIGVINTKWLALQTA